MIANRFMKSQIYHLFCWFSYWLGLDTLFYWFNSRAKRVLCFHHVLPDGISLKLPVDGFVMSAKDFRFIVQEIGRKFRYSTDINEPSSVTMTFDDGFLNQYEVAFNILSEEGDIPACLFVAGKMIGLSDPKSALDCDLLALWATFVPEGEYVLKWNGEDKSFRINNELRRCAWLSVLRPLWIQELQSNMERGTLVKALDGLYPFDEIINRLPEKYARLRLTGISHAQLKDLKSRGWRIGWHTYSHVPLRTLSLEERDKELTAPEEFAQEVMAYPFGSPDAIDDETIAIASRKEYPCAFSYMIDPGIMMARYFLPRMSVPASKYELHCELSGLKHFLKTRRLLPRFPTTKL